MNYFKKKKVKKMVVGLSSLTKVADKLKALDMVLSLFGMKVGAENFEVDCTDNKYSCVRLTVYFVKEKLSINIEKVEK